MGNELIGEVMTPSPLYVPKEELATKVRAIFRRSGFKGLPVVDEKTRVLGLITLRELLKVTSTRSNLTASGLMTRVLVYLTPGEPLAAGVKKMLQAGVDRAVVVDSGSRMRLLGVLSMHDVLKALQGIYPIKETPVGDFMTREMMEGGVSGLPVVEKGKLLGIIDKDILKEVFDA